MSNPEKISVVIYREADLWIAQCLEYDIGAQADDIESLWDRLLLTLRMEASERGGNGVGPFAGIDPAPAYFARAYAPSFGVLSLTASHQNS
jgi:hypothetical protein